MQLAHRQDTRRVPRAPPPKKWRPLQQPRAIEGSYTEALVSVLDRGWARLLVALAPVLKEAEKDERADGLHLDAKRKRAASVTFEVVVEDLPEALEESFSEKAVAPAAEKTAKATDAAHLRALRQQFAQAVGIQVLQAEPTLEKPVRDFTARNVGLIKSLKGEVLERLKRELGAALDSGARPPELAKMLQEQYGVARRKAEFIARDQVGKLYASLTQERHEKLGITRYKWRTVRDNRVRPLHVKREGKVFEYDKPPHEDPTDGHAGHAPRDRCWQEPILDDVLPPAETVKRERETVDPAPPEAPRPPKSVVPVEKVTEVLKQVERTVRAAAEPAKRAPVKKAATKAPRAAPPERPKPAVAKAVKAATQPLVDMTKGWKHTRVYQVPVEWLDDVPAMVWQSGRAESIRRAYKEGKAKELPPIMVHTANKVTGLRELSDGNHRLSVARERGEKFIAVRFSDKAAAAMLARPKNPGAPWFIRDNPQDYPHLVNPDGTPKTPAR